MLVSSLIRLVDDDLDQPIWSKNPTSGEYTTKLGYKEHLESLPNIQWRWWWSYIWKHHGPLKRKLTLWLALANNYWWWTTYEKQGGMGLISALFVFQRNIPSHASFFNVLMEKIWKSLRHIFFSCSSSLRQLLT